MNELKDVKSERVDDIPLLLAEMDKLGIAEIIDSYMPGHGSRQGLSLGKTVSVWLSYILSAGDHRKSYVEDWVKERLSTLSGCLQTGLKAGELNDDRLGDVLRELRKDEAWQACEQALNRRSLRVYQLSSEVVRCDSTTVSSYGCVDEAGLLQFGHSKDYRPDLPQVKVASTTLDPLGMPLATLVVSGEQADDGLYQPLINEVHASFGKGGLLFVGDSKMAALATRAALSASGDYYLCPLSKVQLAASKLSAYLQRPEAQTRTEIRRLNAKESELVAEGFELSEVCSYKGVQWTERRLVICSLAQADKQVKQLEVKLQQAQAELTALVTPRKGKSRPQSRAEPETKVAEVLKRYQVIGLLTVDLTQQQEQRSVRAYRTRPARVETQLQLQLSSRLDEAAITAYKQLGWRVLACTQPATQLPLAKASLVHRNAYLHEQGYSRLKGKPLSLTPLYLQRDEQIKGLIRLLSIALSVLTLIEFGLRRELAKKAQTLQGLYAGNPKRTTARPSTELLLYAFRNITLTRFYIAEQLCFHLTELSSLQTTILQLLELEQTIYTDLAQHSSKHLFV